MNGIATPDPGEEILLYQDLLGAWPLDEKELPGFRNRIENYMVKAIREAKVYTRWMHPNIAHENAVKEFVAALLSDLSPETNQFLAEFLPFQGKIAHYGALNSLAQVVLKIASPGVPDIYQGRNFWDFSLVDPDNRRAVDFQGRIRLLNELMNQEHRGTPPPGRGAPLLLAGRTAQALRDVQGARLPAAAAGAVPFGSVPSAPRDGGTEGARAGLRAGAWRCVGDRGRSPAHDPPGAAG